MPLNLCYCLSPKNGLAYSSEDILQYLMQFHDKHVMLGSDLNL